MTNPPGLPPDPNAPPTSPMYPVQPPAQPPSNQAPEPPAAPTYPAQPSYPPQGGYPSQPAYPQPPAYQEPPAGYSVPPQYSAVPPGAGFGDALVLPPGASFGIWFNKVQEVAKRSWKSALIIMFLGIAVPRAVAGVVGAIGGWTGGLSFGTVGDLSSEIGRLFLGALLSIVCSIAACYVAGAGWAAGTWALVQEAQTGQPANVQAAFRYGFKRAMALFPWTVLVAVLFTIATICFVVPGIYVAFGASMFGFVVLFERGKNPLGRSFSMTHANFGPTLGRIAIVFAIYWVYSLIIGLIFGAIAVGAGFATGFNYSYGDNLMYGLISAIGTLLTFPGFAVLLIGLLPTYAELRAREAPLSTAQLQHELGA